MDYGCAGSASSYAYPLWPLLLVGIHHPRCTRNDLYCAAHRTQCHRSLVDAQIATPPRSIKRCVIPIMLDGNSSGVPLCFLSASSASQAGVRVVGVGSPWLPTPTTRTPSGEPPQAGGDLKSYRGNSWRYSKMLEVIKEGRQHPCYRFPQRRVTAPVSRL